MNNGVSYSPDRPIVYRFYEHVKFALKKDIPEHGKNLLEKVGDIGLWPIENLPNKIWPLVKDPRIVTVALTALALSAVSFAFYPLGTVNFFTRLMGILPWPTKEEFKFAAYLAIVSQIVSAALRAEGRFCNTELREKWYRMEFNSNRI